MKKGTYFYTILNSFMNLDIVRPEQVHKLFIIINIIQIYIMDNLFLVVYDYPWSIDGTDVWITKPYKLASSLKDAKKDARFYKRIYLFLFQLNCCC